MYGISFSISSSLKKFAPKSRKTIGLWLEAVIRTEGGKTGEISINFVGKEEILRINQEYLSHSYFTDIITFGYEEGENPISGELFICPEVVKDNAEKYGTLFETELSRVMVHGVLHLCGYKDKNKAQVKEMRSAEEKYLRLLRKKTAHL